MPHRKSLASVWRRVPQRYRGESTMCNTCGTHFFPPRYFCPACRRKSDIKEYTASGLGKVYSYTIVHVPQEGFELEVPYILALIDLEEGARLTAQLCDVQPEDVKIGMDVELAFRKVSAEKAGGIIHYAYKFAPIHGQSK